MKNKIEKYEAKANKIAKTLIGLGTCIFLLAILISIVYYNNKLPKTINKSESFIESEISGVVIEENYSLSGTGKIYYVSSDGTSSDGTDINNPMSLTTANTKHFQGNDKVLFKCGDTFYGQIAFSIDSLDNSLFYIGSYGKGEKPIISGAKILTNRDAWNINGDTYLIDLSNHNNFEGIEEINTEPYNIGFLAGEDGEIHGNRKESRELLENEFDFYCESNYLFLKCSQNPSDMLGKIKFVSKLNLVRVSSNTVLENLDIQYTGAHGISKKDSIINNILIRNCIVQNIGGSVQNKGSFIRYGNGIEFWADSKNVQIENNIIRNCYDAGFTLQGTSGEWRNVIVKNNILIQNCFSFELWGQETSTGMYNIHIYNNMCVNQGRRLGARCKTRYIY